MKKLLSGNKPWIENCKEKLQHLQNLKVTKKTDRLKILQNWIIAHNMLSESLMGWTQWLNNIHVIEQIDKKTLKELFETYKEFTEAFVAFDVEATEFIDSILHKDEEEEKDKRQVYTV